jgi:predicted MPP superfamily phosphohydrolase
MKRREIKKMARLRTKRFKDNSIKDKILRIVLWVVPIILLIVLIWSQNNLVITDNIVFKVEGLPKSFVGYKIVHVSDLCNSSLNIVDDVKKLEPDIIILSGGYCDSDGNADKTVKQVKELCKIADVYYVYNSSDKDVLKDTKAINLTNENIVLETGKIKTEDFIKEVYGNSILKKAENGDKEAKEYVKYVEEALKESKDASINLIGVGNFYNKDGKWDSLDFLNSVLEQNESEYKICITGNLENLEELSKADIDMIFSSGTFGTNLISDEYTKGTYGVNGTQLFLTAGIGKHKDVVRIFNFPQIQCITLSDGTIKNKNTLEKFIGLFVSDVGTIFDNDEGFREYKYEYTNGNEQ